MTAGGVICNGRRRRWSLATLQLTSSRWRQQHQQRLGATGALSEWWVFIARWPQHITHWLHDFSLGQHRFSPLPTYQFPNETVTVWSYLD